jgi:hypothetical protein
MLWRWLPEAAQHPRCGFSASGLFSQNPINGSLCKGKRRNPEIEKALAGIWKKIV